MREKAPVRARTIALTADVSKAQRQVPSDSGDWHLLGCQVRAGGDMYKSTVGTLGVASASYYDPQQSDYLAGSNWSLTITISRQADSPNAQRSWYHFFCVELREYPCHGTSHQLETSQRRAEWFIRWTKEVSDLDTVNMSSFEERLGRVMHVTKPRNTRGRSWDHFIMFMSIHSRGSYRVDPPSVVLLIFPLATGGKFASTAHAMQLESWDTAPRFDAQAKETRTGVGAQ